MRWKLQVGRLTHWPVESTIFWKLLYESFLPFQSGFRELFLQLHLNEAEVAGAWLHHFFFFFFFQDLMAKPKKRTEKPEEDFNNNSVTCAQN